MQARKIQYRPEIDGLRAISVLAVILFHMNPTVLPGGFMGVDVFFVISGYLITSIIAAEFSDGTFSFRAFWARRVRRIFPALAVMLLITLLTVATVGLAWLTQESAKEAIASVFGLGNYRAMVLTSNYWGAQSERIPLLHTWSLGVEEQFYLFYPIGLYAIMRFLGARSLFWVLGVIFCLSAAWCAFLTQSHPDRAFFLMLPRGWELLAGAMVAILRQSRTTNARPSSGWIANASLVAVLLSVVFLDNNSGFPWPVAALPVAAAALFIYYSGGSELATRATTLPMPVAVGKASYSLYLWHWPYLVIGTLLAGVLELPQIRTAFLLLGIAGGIASYAYIEPLGKLRNFIRVYAPGLAVLTLGLAGALAWRLLPEPKAHYTERNWEGSRYDSISAAGLQPSILGVDSQTGEDAGWVLIGDSHALALAPALDVYLKAQGKAGLVFASGGSRITSWNPTRYDMLPGARAKFEKMRDEFLSTRAPKVVILSARWETFDKPDGLESVDQLVAKIHALTPNSRIIVVAQPPHLMTYDMKMHEWLNCRHRLGHLGTRVMIQANENDAFNRAHQHLADLCHRLGYVELLVLNEVFPVRDGRVETLISGEIAYDDDDHLSLAGANLVVAKIESALSATSR